LRTRLVVVLRPANRGCSVEPWGRVALQQAKTYVISSHQRLLPTPRVLEALRTVADTNGSHIHYIRSGPLLGGASTRWLQPLRLSLWSIVLHTIVKPCQKPGAEPLQRSGGSRWSGACVRSSFFSGTGARGGAPLSAKRNVKPPITALAGLGLDRTRVVLWPIPSRKGNSHKFAAPRATSAALADIDIENRAPRRQSEIRRS